MSSLRQVVLGLVAALVSAGILLGSLALALAESGLQTARLETTPSPVIPLGFPTLTPTPAQATLLPSPTTQTTTPLLSLTPSQTALQSLTLTLTLSPSAPMRTMTVTPSPVTSVCPLPTGWSTITVRAGDTLQSLANQYNITPEYLKQANCLVGSTLFPGSQLYVPAPPPAQPTIPCGPPSGWVLGYTVSSGDTLYRIATMFGVKVYQLQQANCMGYSTLIHPGQRLYVPYVPTNTPVPPTLTPIPASETPTTAPSATATQAPTLPPTVPPTEPPTATPTPLPTATQTPTEVPSPTSTLTNTPEPSPTSTLTNTPEPSPTPTETPSLSAATLSTGG